jgi:hypothetical protein
MNAVNRNDHGRFSFFDWWGAGDATSFIFMAAHKCVQRLLYFIVLFVGNSFLRYTVLYFDEKCHHIQLRSLPPSFPHYGSLLFFISVVCGTEKM